MYDWLTDALDDTGTVITANRRLARVLKDQFVREQIAAGAQAWRSPGIFALQDWLAHVLRASMRQASLPTRINQHQSQLLWERCLVRELPDATAGVSGLVRLSRDAWQRLAEWQISIKEVARSAQNDDQRLFASVAGRYLGILEREHWVDDAGLAQLVVDEILGGHVPPGRTFTFAGFDRERPIVGALQAALAGRGVGVNVSPPPDAQCEVALECLDNTEAEMRAAGAWARSLLQDDPQRSIAIIASDLEQQASTRTRLVREGLVPGWQYAAVSVERVLNVSYGRRLTDFPAVATALLLLRWLVHDLPSNEVGQLLRSPLFGPQGLDGRSRLELRLRKLPDRRWSPSMLSGALRSKHVTPDAAEWLNLVARLTKLRREIPRSNSPAAWAVFIDDTLRTFGWPGQGALDSRDFQLVNRWRELLNDFARLDLVNPAMAPGVAVRRVELMAAETVFQPESQAAGVQLLGPLEASGAEFDALWISGVTATRWPPPGNASPLLSRRLQREHSMPDATPADTVRYAGSMLQRLGRSAPIVVFSYPATEDDAIQTPTALLQSLQMEQGDAASDPGWHASSLTQSRRTVAADDPVPAVRDDEHVSGGAATIQLQLSEPIAAFITGRLGVKRLQAQAVGIPPPVRGSIIHDALYRLYVEKPSRSAIASWTDDDLETRLTRSVDEAFTRHERHADTTLRELLALERERIKRLLQRFIEVDVGREDFEIEGIEQEVGFASARVSMPLRVDRIDRLADGSLGIIDYKTGTRKTFLQSGGEPREIQLVAYACAVDGTIASLALANIDSREVVFDGAGRGYRNAENWDETLGVWMQSVIQACEEISRGDVRINAARGVSDARPLNLLTRYTELRRDR